VFTAGYERGYYKIRPTNENPTLGIKMQYPSLMSYVTKEDVISVMNYTNETVLGVNP
jgi:hypothetical protein